MNEKDRKEMVVSEEMMVVKEEVDHEYLALLCSIQGGSPSPAESTSPEKGWLRSVPLIPLCLGNGFTAKIL